jgi:hypothetical protein
MSRSEYTDARPRRLGDVTTCCISKRFATIGEKARGRDMADDAGTKLVKFFHGTSTTRNAERLMLEGPGGPHDGTSDPAYWSAPVRMACYQDLSRNGVPTQRSCTAWWTNNAVLGKALTESWRLICDSAMGKVVDGCPAEDMVGRCTDTTSGTSSFAQEVVSYAPVSTTASARKKCSAVFTAP